MVMSSTVSDLTRAPVEILGAMAFVGYFAVMNEMLGLVLGMALAFPLLIIPIAVLGRYVKQHSRQALERISDLVSRMHENFTGVKVVKAFDMEDREAERFVGMNRDYFGSIVRALRAELFMTPFMEGVAIIIAVGILVVCFSKGVKLSEIVPIILAGIVAYRPLKQLTRIGANLQKGAAALGRIFEVVDVDTALPVATNPVKLKGFERSIDFVDVSFRYDADGGDVLRNIALSLKKGTVLALVGETGSGKTTIANLLARFYDPTEGQVAIDGVDLREAEVSSLRRLIGVVTQETILFNDTVANNIAYGMDGTSMEQIIQAARKANAHDFIVAGQEGYDRVVGEKGFVLSGGEKQRIAIARAILRDPPILILDEATSALDTITERLVQEAIAHVMEGRTVLAIAHRLSTVKHADQILLLANGKIAEQGTHEELHDAGGAYRALCDVQMLDG
jgi:subfamily B ATP-binding cassette protein MsbA